MPLGTLCGKQLVSAFHLAVVRILNLQPRRTAAVALIRSTRQLRDDVLEITPGDVRQRPEAVKLYLIQPVGMIEGFRSYERLFLAVQL